MVAPNWEVSGTPDFRWGHRGSLPFRFLMERRYLLPQLPRRELSISIAFSCDLIAPKLERIWNADFSPTR